MKLPKKYYGNAIYTAHQRTVLGHPQFSILEATRLH